ncbi:MAG: O-antigen ligase family protein [Chloroflexota bacterium]|nr:O-antigen ligase family protein [Chloroflexota bacterium]
MSRRVAGARVLLPALPFPWWYIPLIVGTAGVAAGLPPAVGLGVAGALVGGVLVLRRPVWAVYALILSVPVQRELSLNGGATATQAIMVALLASWWAWTAVRRRAIRIPPFAVALGVYLVVMLLSLTVATSLPAGGAEISRWAVVVLAYLIIVNTVHSRAQIGGLIACFLAGALGEALVGIWQVRTGQVPPSFFVGQGHATEDLAPRAFGTIGMPNSYAGYLNLTLPLALALSAYALVWALRWWRRADLSPQPPPLKGEGPSSSPSPAMGGNWSPQADKLPRPRRGEGWGEGRTLLPSQTAGRLPPSDEVHLPGRDQATNVPPSPQPSPLRGEGARLALSPSLRRGGGRGVRSVAALALTAGTALMLVALVLSYSRGGFVGLAVGVGAMAVALGRRGWPILGTLAAGTLIAAGLIYAGLFPRPLVERLNNTLSQLQIYDVRGAEWNADTFAQVERLAHWQTAGNMFLSNPVLGVGIGNFNTDFFRFSIAGWPKSAGHAHNYYLQALAETGGLGLLAYLGVLAAAGWGGWRAVRGAVRAGRGWDSAVLIGAFGVFVAIMSHSIFEDLHVLNMGIHWAAVIALFTLVPRLAAPQQEAST